MAGKKSAWLLLEALRDAEGFASRGFTARFEPWSSVIIERAGHFRGIWTANGEEFIWAAAGYSVPVFKAPSLREALDYTLTEICGGG